MQRQGDAQAGGTELYEAVLGNPDCLGIVVRHATKYPIGSTAIAKVSCVSKAWRQASLPSPQPPIQNLVLDMIQALESASIEERGAECVACDSKPELSEEGKPAARCRCCGAPTRIAGLNERQCNRWSYFYRGMGQLGPSAVRVRTAPTSGMYTDYQEFDEWLARDMYDGPDRVARQYTILPWMPHIDPSWDEIPDMVPPW